MAKLLPSTDDEVKMDRIDLYYNDIICLENTIKAIRSKLDHK